MQKELKANDLSYWFDMSYHPERFNNEQGLFVVMATDGDEYVILDIGEAEKLKTHLSSIRKKPCYGEKSENLVMDVTFGVSYTPGWDRVARVDAVSKLKEVFKPVCE